MKLSLLVLRCQNIEVSKQFYTDLGLDFIEEKHGEGPRHYSSEFNGMVLELYPNQGQAPQDNNRLGFSIADIESVTQKVGIQSTYQYDGSTIYVTVDPDGRKIELS